MDHESIETSHLSKVYTIQGGDSNDSSKRHSTLPKKTEEKGESGIKSHIQSDFDNQLNGSDSRLERDANNEKEEEDRVIYQSFDQETEEETPRENDLNELDDRFKVELQCPEYTCCACGRDADWN